MGTNMDKHDSVLFPIIRYTLIGLGTNLVQSGMLNEAQLETAVGALITLGATAWMLFNKKYRHPKQAAARLSQGNSKNHG